MVLLVSRVPDFILITFLSQIKALILKLYLLSYKISCYVRGSVNNFVNQCYAEFISGYFLMVFA